eukprot:TRINITY_DN90_c0_g1_i15.p2 TRINITY_DN90_c0_g1~~TRINITY_DN90_c0_g1_i15.p2  ORF type:complete len:151 (-),score=35.84 TRINITY_DN90_c0_g1_i15:486-878(-)
MPKRKIERNRLRPPFRKQVVSILNKLTDSNFDTLSTELLCSAVEDVRNDEHMSMTLVKCIFNKALNQVENQILYANMWRKLFECAPNVTEAREPDDAGLHVRVHQAPAQKSWYFCDEMGRAIMQEEDPQI